ncbi:helix-turn-helix transcriptional regulator [Spongisporangium articulatum]|uniref:Helix-turn-helix transcriptional regulator n=1 Tax=Spongisporangium articulatum TaxID=3362603 RepID=A0ABW8AQI9_9ACTN
MSGDQTFGRLAAARRAALGLDQQTVAAAVGVTQQTISRWESGGAMPRRGVMASLARILQVDADQLFRSAGYAPERPPGRLDDAVHTLNAEIQDLSDAQLVALLDLLWREHYERTSRRSRS